MFALDMPNGYVNEQIMRRFPVSQTSSANRGDKIYYFCVERAMELIIESDKGIERLDLVGSGINAERILDMNPDINIPYAMNTDLGLPVIFGMMNDDRYQGSQLLDGWHRSYHHAAVGNRYIPTFVLTPEETLECLVMVRGINDPMPAPVINLTDLQEQLRRDGVPEHMIAYYTNQIVCLV